MFRIMRFALICAALWLTPYSTAQAQAATYLNEAVQALQSGNVYVSVEVTDIDAATKEQLARQADSTDVAVVALPEAATSETGANTAQFAFEIANRTGEDTVVVSIGGDLTAVSRSLESGEAANLADEAEADASSTGEALLNFIAEVREARPEPQNSQPSSDGGGFGGLAVYFIIVVLAILAGIYAAKRILGPKGGMRIEAMPPPAPESIRELLGVIRELGSQIRDPVIQRSLSEGERHTQQLFSRLIQAGSNQIEETTATYVGHLRTVRSTLVHVKDIEVNRDYYEDADLLLENGREAVQQYEEGVLQNTREVVRGSLTDFRVNVKLLSAMNKTNDPKIS